MKQGIFSDELFTFRLVLARSGLIVHFSFGENEKTKVRRKISHVLFMIPKPPLARLRMMRAPSWGA